MNLDLKRASGIPLNFDGEKLTSDDISFRKRIVYQIDDLTNQLINDDLSYPEYIYTKYTAGDIKGIFESKNLKLNFYTISSGVAGIEFIKTKASILHKHDRIIEVLYGGGICIIQKNDGLMPIDIIISKIKSTDKLIIPASAHAVFINTKPTNLIISEIYSNEALVKYELEEVHGLAYYVISKNSRPEIVRNPAYKVAPKQRKVDWNGLANKLSISPKTPLLKQILRKYDKFDWIFKENSSISF